MDPYIDIPQKKRGRKKKECSVLDSVSISNSINNNNNNNNDNDNDDNDDNDNDNTDRETGGPKPSSS